MIDLRGNIQLEAHKSTLKETARDSAHDVSMVHSDVTVVNMDSLARAYAEKLERERALDHVEVSPSVDALHISKAGVNTLIEFKNGKVKWSQIRDKVCHSTLLLGDLGSFDVSASRNEIDFVLVFNGEAYTAAEHDPDTGEEDYDSTHRVQASKSRSFIGSAMNRKANKPRSYEQLRKGVVEKIEGYMCRSVRVLTVEQFVAECKL